MTTTINDQMWVQFARLASELVGAKIEPDQLRSVAASAGVSIQEDHSARCAALYHDGWKYGEVEDHGAKTSPWLRPWGELAPELQRVATTMRAIASCGARIMALRAIDMRDTADAN